MLRTGRSTSPDAPSDRATAWIAPMVAMLLFFPLLGATSVGSPTPRAAQPDPHTIHFDTEPPQYAFPNVLYSRTMLVRQSCEGAPVYTGGGPEWQYSFSAEHPTHTFVDFSPASESSSTTGCSGSGIREMARTTVRMTLSRQAAAFESFPVRFVVHWTYSDPAGTEEGRVEDVVNITVGFRGAHDARLTGERVEPYARPEVGLPEPGHHGIRGIEGTEALVYLNVTNRANGPARFVATLGSPGPTVGDVTLPDPFVVPAGPGPEATGQRAITYRFGPSEEARHRPFAFAVAVNSTYAGEPPNGTEPFQGSETVILYMHALSEPVPPGLAADLFDGASGYTRVFGLVGVLAVAAVIGGILTAWSLDARRRFP